jgi:hypothetical protein
VTERKFRGETQMGTRELEPLRYFQGILVCFCRYNIWFLQLAAAVLNWQPSRLLQAGTSDITTHESCNNSPFRLASHYSSQLWRTNSSSTPLIASDSVQEFPSNPVCKFCHRAPNLRSSFASSSWQTYIGSIHCTMWTSASPLNGP